MSDNNLESLYNEAQQALKAKDYDRATSLLKQVLVIDDDYKDTSRLLARLVHEKRRRWYNDLRIWGPLGGLVLIGLLIWIVPKLPLNTMFAHLSTPTIAWAPTNTTTPAPISFPSKTPIPLAWRRISLGQEFPRDTITAIVANPKDADIIYVSTGNTGVYKSIDGGLSWQPMLNGLAIASIGTLVIAPDKPDVLYAGVLQGGVYKTTDGGKVWFPINKGIYARDAREVSIVAIDPQDSSHLFYVRDRGPFGGALSESTNGGLSWTTNSSPSQEIVALALHPQEKNTLFIGGRNGDLSSGIYKSIDGGKSWELKGLSDRTVNTGKLWVDPIDGTSLYTQTDKGSYFSLDGGSTWKVAPYELYGCAFREKVATCTTDVGIVRNAGDGSSWQIISSIQLGFNATLYSSPVLESTYYLGGNSLYISSDNGSSWKEYNNGLPNPHVDLFPSPSTDSKMLVISRNSASSSDGQAFSSMDNGKSWIPFLPDFSNITNLSFDADTNTIYIVSDEGLVKTDDGKNWTKLSTPLRFARVEANPKIPGVLYGIGQDSQGETDIYISSDGGMNWGLAPSQDLPDACKDYKFYFDQQGRLIYFHDGCLMASSENDGQSWDICEYIGSPTNSETGLLISPADKYKLLFATRGEGIHFSNSGCIIFWNKRNQGLGNLYINTLAVDPNNPDTVYAGADGGAFISYNFGETWNEINDGLLGATVVYSIVVDKDSNVYAATPYGIFKLEGK